MVQVGDVLGPFRIGASGGRAEQYYATRATPYSAVGQEISEQAFGIELELSKEGIGNGLGGWGLMGVYKRNRVKRGENLPPAIQDI